MARREGRVSVASLRDLLRIDSDEVRRLLNDLANRGLPRQAGVEQYELWSAEPRLRPAGAELVDALSYEFPMGIHELAAVLGKSPTSLRPQLRRLIRDGHVRATAPATSRSRRYLRVR